MGEDAIRDDHCPVIGNGSTSFFKPIGYRHQRQIDGCMSVYLKDAIDSVAVDTCVGCAVARNHDIGADVQVARERSVFAGAGDAQHDRLAIDCGVKRDRIIAGKTGLLP